MRSLRDRLEDILASINKIEGEAKHGKKQFLSDEKSQVWVIYHLQVIGEAVRAIANDL